MSVINYMKLDCFIISVLPNLLDNGINSFHTPNHTPKNRTRGEKGERGKLESEGKPVGGRGRTSGFCRIFFLPPVCPPGFDAVKIHPHSGGERVDIGSHVLRKMYVAI